MKLDSLNIPVILFFLLCCISLDATCQGVTGTLAGRIMDADSRPLPYSTITVVNKGSGAVADQEGRFSLQLEEGDYLLEFSSVGYSRMVKKVRIVSGNSSELNIELKEVVEELNPVVITATRSERQLSELPIPLTLIGGERIEEMGSLRLDQVLAEQTGLAVINDHGPGIQVQGFDPDYTLILVDGEPLIGRTAGTLDLSRIAVGNIRQVEIVKGPSSSLYGSEALAGVVNIITENPSGMNLNLDGRYGTNQTHNLRLNSNYKKNNTGVNIFIDQFGTGGYDLYDEVYGQSVDPYYNSTITSRITHRVSDKTKVNLSGRYFRQAQESNLDIGSGQHPAIVTGEGKEQDRNINSQVTHLWNDRIKTTARFYITSYDARSRLEYQQDGRLYDSTFFQQTFIRPELQNEIFLNQKGIITLGLGTTSESVEATRYDQKQRFSNRYLYFQYEREWRKKINFIAGGRFDDHSVYRSQFSPKLSLQYQAYPSLSIRASFGVGFKAPDFRQLYLNFSNTVQGYNVLGSEVVVDGISQLREEGQLSEIFIDPSTLGTLLPESSRAINLGFQWEPSENYTLSTNIFRNDITDMIQTGIIARKNSGQSVFSYFNLKEVYTQGLEADFSYDLSPYLELSGGYQYLMAYDKEVKARVEEGNIFARDPSTGVTYRVSRDNYGGLFGRSRHMANSKLFYSHPNGWSASFRAIYRGRYGFGDRNSNAILDIDSEYVPGFLQVNISASRKINQWITWQAGCDNLFDFTNREFIPGLPGRLVWTSVSVDIGN